MVFRVPSSSSRHVQPQTTYCDYRIVSEEDLALNMSEDLYAAQMADTVTGFSYLMHETVELNPPDSTADGVIVTTTTQNKNSVSQPVIPLPWIRCNIPIDRTIQWPHGGSFALPFWTR